MDDAENKETLIDNNHWDSCCGKARFYLQVPKIDLLY